MNPTEATKRPKAKVGSMRILIWVDLQIRKVSLETIFRLRGAEFGQSTVLSKVQTASRVRGYDFLELEPLQKLFVDMNAWIPIEF